MTSDLHRSGLHPVSHLKAGPTTSSSKSTARSASALTTQPASSQVTRLRGTRNTRSRDEQGDALSNKSTTALIRRVLCPQASGSASLEELLPPLTSSNDVDYQLYALVAIIVREFIYSWYSKITSDQIFVNELLQVVAHCTRALEQRLRQVDVAQLVLDEIPALLQAHISSYRLARQQSALSGLHTSPRAIYQTLNPHPGLSPVPNFFDGDSVVQQQENEAAYRQLLVHGTLAVLLPTEDLENTCLRTLLGDILADLILEKQVSGKVCEGWFLWGTITKFIEVYREDPDVKRRRTQGQQQQQRREDRLRKFGLLSSEEDDRQNSGKAQSRFSLWVWSALQYVYMAFITLRFIATGLFRVASRPLSTHSRASKGSSSTGTTTATPTGQRPVLDYRLFGMVSELLSLSQRMPWLEGLLALSQHLLLAGPGRLGDPGSVLDRFLYETIQDYILTPTLLPHLLLASRTTLFSLTSAAPAPTQGANVNRASAVQSPTPPAAAAASSSSSATPVEEERGGGGGANTASSEAKDTKPSLSEATAIKRQCAASILSLIPRPIVRRFFAADNSNHEGNITTTTTTTTANTSSTTNNGRSPSDRIMNGQTTKDDDSQQQKHRGPSVPMSTSESHDHHDHNGSHGQSEEEAFLLAAIEHEFLDLLADEYCNKHLVYAIIEKVLARLLPELTERSVGELMEDRGISDGHTMDVPTSPIL